MMSCRRSGGRRGSLHGGSAANFADLHCDGLFHRNFDLVAGFAGRSRVVLVEEGEVGADAERASGRAAAMSTAPGRKSVWGRCTGIAERLSSI